MRSSLSSSVRLLQEGGEAERSERETRRSGPGG